MEADVHRRRLIERTVRSLAEPGAIVCVTEEEAKQVLGPFLAAIVAGLPTPPAALEQLDLLIRLLTGEGLQTGRSPVPA
jgi:hypothetical protein